MSYKVDLSHIDRGQARSLTDQIADAFVSAIESGRLAPGDKLPTTRALAEQASVNHLTAARVYKRLGEQGYVTAQVGRGTFVRASAVAAMEGADEDWQSYVLPEHMPSYTLQVHQEAFHRPLSPDTLSMAVGWPSPELFPVDELAALTAEVFADEGGEALTYLPAEGLPALREVIAARGRLSGFATSPEEIIVTTGARQGLDLAARALLRPGDVAVIESPSFTGSIISLEESGARVIGVPLDDDGFDVDALEQILARHEVKLVALQAACQNPTGRDLSPERRERLVALARERSFFIVEDGVYATMRFEGEPFPRLRAAAPGHVVYVDSLSKSVGGGLRLGWIAASGPVLDRLAELKMNTDVHTTALSQHIASRYLRSGAHEEQMRRGLPFYRERRDALLAALDRHLPGEHVRPHPLGGHHAWVTLTRRVDERLLHAEALRQGVTFVPGAAATVMPSARASMRLSFPLLAPDQLDEAVRRLARAVRAVSRGQARTATVAPT